MVTTKMENIIAELKGVRKHYTMKAAETDEFAKIESEEMDELWRMFRDLESSSERLIEEARFIDNLIIEMDKLVQSIKTEAP